MTRLVVKQPVKRPVKRTTLVNDPYDLFGYGSAGFYGDVGRFDKTLTTHNGTTRVAAANDPIGRIERLAGSLNLTQDVSGSRPVLARLPRGGIRNRLSNNMAVGVVAGSPGTAPTGWPMSSTAGVLTRTIGTVSDVVAADGKTIRCVPIRFQFSGAGTAFITQSAVTTIAAAVGQQWSNTCYVALSAGALTNISAVGNIVSEYDSGSSFLTNGVSNFTPTATLTRYEQNRTNANASCAYVSPGVYITATGAADITLLVGQPQMERAATASEVQQVSGLIDVTESGQPSIWLPYFDGTDDYLKTSAQAFGTASLFAGSSQEWTVPFVFKSSTTVSQMFVAKSGSDGGLATLRLGLDNSQTIRITCRGTTNDFGSGLINGVVHVGMLRWNRTALQLWLDQSLAGTSVPVGSAVEESQNITVGCRIESAPAAYMNGNLLVGFINRSLSDIEVAAEMRRLNTKYRFEL